MDVILLQNGHRVGATFRVVWNAAAVKCHIASLL